MSIMIKFAISLLKFILKLVLYIFYSTWLVCSNFAMKKRRKYSTFDNCGEVWRIGLMEPLIICKKVVLRLERTMHFSDNRPII